MKVRVYLRRNLTKLAGAVASGNMNLAIANVLTTYSYERWICHW